MSRKISDLIPKAQVKLLAFLGRMAENGIPVMITSTYRSQEEQDVLFSQGRTKPGKVVTWTRASRHTQRDAFDIAILRSGQPVWDSKVDVDLDGVPDYLEAGKIGESLGLVWGGRWKQADPCHFQLADKEVG